VTYAFHPPRPYSVQWSTFDNMTRKLEPIPGSNSPHLPAEVLRATSGTYFAVHVSAPADQLKPVVVYVRRQENEYKVVGIDRY